MTGKLAIAITVDDVYVELGVNDRHVNNDIGLDITGDKTLWNGGLTGEVDVDINEYIDLSDLSGFTNEIVEEIIEDYGLEISIPEPPKINVWKDNDLVRELASRAVDNVDLPYRFLEAYINARVSRAIVEHISQAASDTAAAVRHVSVRGDELT